MADGDKKAVAFEVFALAGFHVLETNAGDAASLWIAVNFFDDRVPDKRDFGIFLGAVLHDL